MGEIMDSIRGVAFSLSNNKIDMEGDTLIVKFTYDAEYYGRATSIPGSHYNKEKKQFEIHKGYLRRVVQNFPGFTKSPEVFNEISKQKLEDKEHKELVKQLFKENDFSQPINGRTPMKHQIQAAEFILKNKKSILADDMGCIDGEALIHINRGGNGKKYTLKDLYTKFNGDRWNKSIPTYTRSFCDGEFRLNKVVSVLDKGIKEVVQLTLKSNKTLVLTPDHEVLTNNGWVEAKDLKLGDKVITNGTPVCKECNGTANVSTYKYAKFVGYCRNCIYKFKRINGNYKRGWLKDTDGYIQVTSQWNHPNHTKAGLVPQHVLVMEEKIGRYLTEDEVAHHLNEIKDDNRIENLELLTRQNHSKLHGEQGGYIHLNGGKTKNGGKVIFLPKEDEVVAVIPFGEKHVYDIVCEDPHRNFVANGIVVHNCGKTLSSLLAMSLTGLPIYVIAPRTLHDNWFSEANMLDVKIKDIFSWGSIKTFPKGEFCVIADEAHYAQNISSKRTKNFLKFVSNAKFLVCVTGTPIANSNPKNAYPLLTAVDDPLSYNKRIYEEYYCNLRASNHMLRLKEFYENTKHIILRRRIEDCVDLPEKTRVLRAADLTPLAAKTYEDVYNRLRNSYIERISKGLIVDTNEKMMMFMQLRHAASFAKIGETIKIAKEIHEQNHSTVFFVSFVDVAELLQKELEKIAPCGILHGKVPVMTRSKVINDFQSGTSKFIICTYGTGGVGINLFTGNHVVLVDRPWTPKDTSQAEARVYRTGQTKKVLSIWIQCNKTDQRIDSLILSKSRRISTMLNGDPDEEEINFDVREEIDRLFDEIFEV